ncbi:MAG: multidrug effflux MFS transporter [Alphaproteobacteria bacterium]|nr:multidrug effflux MFS transporter [Alphaproteobacteria bacterium]
MSNNNLLINLVIMMCVITIMGSDLFAPSLPQIGQYYALEESVVQLLISVNLFGVGISSLLYGSLSDNYGRRSVILGGMALFCIGSIACLIIPNFTSFVIARFIQGCGEGVAVSVGLAAIYDRIKGSDYAKVVSKLCMIISLAPGIAPIAGGYIATYSTWYVALCIIAMSAFIINVILWKKLPETLLDPHHHSVPKYFKEFWRTTLILMKNPIFMSCALVQGLTIGVIWAELANMPFIFIQSMGLPTEFYGYFMAMGVGAYIIGSKINQHHVGKIECLNLLIFGVSLKLFSGLLLIAGSYYLTLTPWFVFLLSFPGSMGIGFILGNAMACAMESVKGKNTGNMTSFIGGTEMLVGSISVTIVGFFYDGTMIPIGGIVSLFMLFNLGMLFCNKAKITSVNLTLESTASSA